MNQTTKFIGAFLSTFILIAVIALLAAKSPYVLMSFSFLVPIIFFIYPRVLCTLELYNMEMYEIDTKAPKFPCFIPFYNIYYGRKLQYASAPIIGGLLIAILVELALITPIARFVINTGDVGLIANVLVSWLNIVAVLVLWGIEAYVNVALAKQVGYGNLILCVLIPPVASFFLSKRMVAFFNENKNEIKGTFKGEE